MGLGGPGRRGAGSGAIVLSESKVWLGPFAKDENDGQPACRLDLPAVLFVVSQEFDSSDRARTVLADVLELA